MTRRRRRLDLPGRRKENKTAQVLRARMGGQPTSTMNRDLIELVRLP